MKIDETLVIPKPQGILTSSPRRQGYWLQKSAIRGMRELRRRIMEKYEIDILNVYEMTDCIEVGIKGDIEGTPALTEWQRRKKRKMISGR